MPRVLNMSVLHRVLQKTAHHIFWVLNILGLEYARVVNSLSHTGFCVNCILKIYSVLNFLSSEYTKVLNVSGV